MNQAVRVAAFHGTMVGTTPLRKGRFAVPEWVKISGGLVAITAGSRTNVWGVNSSGNIYKFSGNDAGDPSPWVHIPGSLSDIGAGADGTVWGVNSKGSVYRYAGDQNIQGSSRWVHIPGSLTRIAVGSRTNVWGVNSSGNIYKCRRTSERAPPRTEVCAPFSVR